MADLLRIDQPVRLRSIEAYILQVHGAVRNLTPDESIILRQWVFLILEYIKDRWPVDTGTSRDNWRAVMTLGEPGSVGFRIINDMHYARWVHRAGAPASPPLWTVLLPAAIQAFKDPLLAAMKVAILHTESKVSEEVARIRDRAVVAFDEPLSANVANNALLNAARMRPLGDVGLSPIGGG